MLVVDSNVAIKLVCAEPGKIEALARFRAEDKLIAPEWMLVEAANAIRRKSLLGEFDREEAELLLALIPGFFEPLYPVLQTMRKAMALSFDLDHWIYDCIYLACALDLDAPMLTADRKFWNAAKRAGYGDVVELLSWQGQPE